jgi:hypothetical protein
MAVGVEVQLDLWHSLDAVSGTVIVSKKKNFKLQEIY